MAKIEPFKAVIYNHSRIKDLASVVCPPYDVISPQKQQYYHEKDAYNFIRLILGKDVPGEDKYLRAGEYLRGWLKDKIFIQDEQPALYFYSQEFSLRGERKTRLGFIGLLELEDYHASVYRHEHTHREAKEDRLKLIREVKANLSPIFAVILDRKRIIQRTFQRYLLDKPPFIETTDDEKTTHRVWRITDPKVLKGIQGDMLRENIFIADGHHRYEVACAWRKESGYNYILAFFTNTDSRGLSILPIHRLLKLKPGLDWEGLSLKLKEYFDLEEIKDKARFFFLMQKAGRTEHLLGIYKDRKYRLLRLKNVKTLDRLCPDKPKEYRTLDVSILNNIVLKNILGFDPQEKPDLIYSQDADELIAAADSGPDYIAFFLNPAKIEQIISVALAGERMPPKSTYFYPKLLSGLLINKHQGL